ncbi:MAG: efflux RND transporter periplasmic adaptor subunit [Planctomycetota bacterium]|nr:MAG: efflux RND transporter periplasmic adaptor subunit [Planctomycetota bacterium]
MGSMQTDTPITTHQATATDSQSAASGWAPSAAPPIIGKLNKKLIVILIAAIIIIPTAYFGVHGLLGQDQSENVQLYKVVRRSFPIILQEKGELQAANSIDIKCELEGRSTIITLIDEGKQVKKGELLVALASDEIDEELREAEIRVATEQADYEAAVKEHEILKDENASNIRKADLKLKLAKLALEKYEKGEGVELRKDAELALDKANYDIERAEKELKDARVLHEQGFVTDIELEDYIRAQKTAAWDREKAILAEEVLEKYTIPMSMEEKKSDVVEAEKELKRTEKEASASEAKSEAKVNAAKSEFDLVQEKLAKLKDQKKKATIKAPADGMVVYTSSGSGHHYREDKQIELGAQVYERQSLIELPDTSKMKVVIRVHEAKTELLEIGLPAVVEIESHSGKQFTGKVSKIGVLADSRNRWLNPNLKEYETEILLNGEFTDLKPGITAHAKIQVTELKNVFAVPVQSIFGKGGKYYVFIDKRGEFAPAEIEVGLSSNEYVEVTKGLKEGQMVSLVITDEMKLKIPDSKGKEKSKAMPSETAKRKTSPRRLKTRPNAQK